MQCTSSYPCPPEKVGLNLLQEFRDTFACPVGLSDHSGTIYPGLAGATLGMDILELHVTFSRDMYGPDVPASVTFDELKVLVDGIRFIETMRANPLDKNASLQGAEPLRRMFMKGLVAATGHFRSGIMLAPVTAEIVRDVIDGRPSRDLAPFAPGR